ncbi:MAG TPA: N-6 DNA methylase [Opitutaceae bacterium]|jgi:type I restriction-modification system DNA methylase subunit|nr:N-6 DNA methylase [Opitutaceae bacterium]
MNSEQARTTIVETFRKKFDDARFLYFIRNLVNHLDESKKQTWTLKKAAFADFVNHFTRLGTYTDPRGERVDILVIQLRKETTLARGRVTLRNFVADYLATGHGQGKAAVMAAFVSPQEDDWRFSFVKLDYTFEKTELGLVAERIQLTPARRYSYLVGKNENCHTAQKQFLDLLQTDHADPSVTALEAAFSVEKVTKEFFEQYRELFENTRDALTKFLKTAPDVATEFDQRGITNDDFAKKLLGQIVFLYFLQKKGWFGVERGKNWGGGRKDFLRHLFTQRVDYAHVPGGRKRNANFFNDILEPLFYEALAYPREADDHYYSRFDCRIPFLNGGLFEPLYGYNWSNTDILLPDALFSNEEPSTEGDPGTGILDVFDRYNFTVNEAEPLEKEVAVDPEMLGKVFENLLPENSRHASGTYYTPRVIVHYMCQQALLHYLIAHAPDIPADDLALFLRLAERFADFEATDTKAHADKRLPPAIAAAAPHLDQLLHTVTVCDPAIGSGAFPVGMMHEIVRARLALTSPLEKQGLGKILDDDEPRTAYGLKRHAIHQSLYGVDLDPGAVEIAKLRLWLSMVVDENEISDIQPLPNLDYKIMQGNSLLEEFEGVRLFDDKVLKVPDDDRERQIAELKEKIRVLSAEGIRAYGEGGVRGAAAKLSADRDIARFKKTLDALLHNQIPETMELAAEESWRRLTRLQKLHGDFFKESNRKKKDDLRTELETLEWDFMRAMLREQGREHALAELERASAKHRKPFFLWWLHFSEIKQKRGGFDIVLANPPFVRMELIKDDKPALKRRFPYLFAGRADLYVYFYGLGLHILREGGCLAFISSNSYLNSKFGGKLRQHFLETTRIKALIDFSETKVFDAVVEPAIIVLQKSTATDGVLSAVKWDETRHLDDLVDLVSKQASMLTQSSFSAEPWQLVGGQVARVLNEMRAGRKCLGDFPDWEPKAGLITGLNRAFLISGKTRSELLKECPQADEIIKPYMAGEDIKRWRVTFSDTYVIYAYHGIEIAKFPAIERHLERYEIELKKRASRQRWCELRQPQQAYVPFFEGPKLVYQEINRSDAFAFDEAVPHGMYVNNKLFFIPNAPKALLALMNSTCGVFFIHTYSGVPRGGFLALQLNIIKALPIPNWRKAEQDVLSKLVEYILWLHRSGVASGDLPDSAGGTLLAGYFEQWVNALVYELFFPDALHAAGLHFFRLAEAAELELLANMKAGSELTWLRAKFEQLYKSDHSLRQSLFALDSIEEIRIIEGKT